MFTRLARKAFQRSVLCYPGGWVPFLSRPLIGRWMPKQAASERPGILLGRYEPAVRLVLARFLKKSSIVYDVGANIGYTSLLMSAYASEGKVYAFEPLPSNLEILRLIVEHNRLQHIIIPVAVAISKAKGQATLQLWRDRTMAFLDEARDSQGHEGMGSLRVNRTTVDSLVFDEALPPPEFLKIDVEGAEALVMEGARRTIARYRPVLLVEVHGPIKAAQTWDAMDHLSYDYRSLNNGRATTVQSKRDLLSVFSPANWTHHLLCCPKGHI